MQLILKFFSISFDQLKGQVYDPCIMTQRGTKLKSYEVGGCRLWRISAFENVTRAVGTVHFYNVPVYFFKVFNIMLI